MQTPRLLVLGITLISLLLPSAGSSETGYQPTFIVFRAGTDLASTLKNLETKGVVIRQSVPPRIAVVEAPTGIDFSKAGVENSYTRAVPLDGIRSLGPVAVAAAVRWNKGLKPAGASGLAGASGVGTYKPPTPQIDRFDVSSTEAVVSWQPVDGVYLYEIEVAGRSDFTTVLRRTMTDRTSVRIPLGLNAAGQLYVRLRALEQPDSLGTAPTVVSDWSSSRTATAGISAQSEGAAPQPMSPVEGYESVGFSVVLEWNAAYPVRLQLSRNADFSSTMIDQVVDDQEFTPPSPALRVGDKIYWRLARWDNQSSPWTAVRTFSIKEPRPSVNDTFVNPEAPR